MAKRDLYAGQPYLEVFSAQSCDKDGSWKLSNGQKEFDNSAKSYVWVLDDTSTKLVFPSANKTVQSCLKQRYLIFQIFVVLESDLSIDLGIHGQTSSKRRVALSTSYRKKRVDSTLAQLPLAFVQRATWMNLCIDISSLVAGCWEKETFKSLSSLTICAASCRIRRMLTMQSQPPDTTTDGETLGVLLHEVGVEVSAIPKQYQFGAEVTTQIVNMAKIVAFEAKSRPAVVEGKTGEDKATARSTTSDKKPSKEGSSAAPKSQKVAKPAEPSPDTTRLPPPAAVREKTSFAGQRSTGNASRGKVSSADASAGQQRTQPGGGVQRDRKMSEPTTGKENERVTSAESQRGNYSSLESSGDRESIRNLNPHPPAEPSTDRVRRRPKVFSAGKDKGGLNSAGSRERLSSSATSSASSSRQNSGTGFRLDGSGRGRGGDWPDTELNANRRRHQSSGKETEESRDASVSESADSDMESTATGTMALTLRSTITSQYNNTLRANDGQEIEKENKLASKVYTFASKPRSPKMFATNATSVAASFVMDPEEYRQAKADSRAQHRVHRRNSRHTRTEMSPAAEVSSEEENVTPRRQPRLRRTPRSKNGTPRDMGPVPLPSSLLPEKSAVHGGPLRQSRESMSRTLTGSPSGCSVSRKSLREISRKEIDELRASVGQRPYDPQNYQMDEADELEEQMLHSMMRSSSSSSDEGRPRILPSTLNYSDPSSGSGSGNERFGDRLDMKGTKHAVRHNYYNEMKLQSQDICALSDPRMCLKMFSPPIVLPSETSAARDASLSKASKDTVKSQKKKEDNDNLYVVYDPDLKVYYDPHTHKYYELR